MSATVELDDPQSVLECRGLTYRYSGSRLANRSIDLHIGHGEILCLLGPNGAGKTTLIRQITGDLPIQEGLIRVCGRKLTADVTASIARMGIIPQNTDLFDGLSVADHLHYIGRLKGLAGNELKSASQRVISQLALEPILSRRAGQLSGGQKRLVLLALALLADPPLLVLDEPTTGLDPAVRSAVWRVISDARSRGKSVLLTTHYLEEAEALSDRLVMIVDGTLIRSGTVREFIGQLQKKIRLSYAADTPQVAYFQTAAEMEAFVAENRLHAYSVAPTSLRDVYELALDSNRDAVP